MRIAVFGAGGAGGYFGAQLAHIGEDVTFIARGEHLHAIREHGLCIETDRGDILVEPAQASDNPETVGAVDVIIVGVKAWQIIEAAHTIQPLVGAGTVVVPLQNGVDAAEQLGAVLGTEHVVGGLCGTFSWVVGPGRIRSIGTNHFVKFGEFNKQPSERVERLRELFARAGVRVQVPADIRAALWEKFLFVAPFGGVGAVTRAPIGVIRSVPETRTMLEGCMREVLAVAQARDIQLPAGIVEKTMAFVDSLAPGGTTSLQRDLAQGKPSELDAWNGAVVRLAREAGVTAPLHEFIYDSLLPGELRARGTIRFPE